MTARTDLDDAWARWQNATLYKTWKKANPGEAAALDAYRAGGPRPYLKTYTGLALVSETDAWLKLAPALGMETLTTAQFDAFIAQGRRAFTDVHLTGAVKINVASVQFENVQADSSVDLLPAADNFLWEGGNGKGIYLYGAQSVMIDSVGFDGENTNDGCKLWGQAGKLPSHLFEGCSFKHFWNSSPQAHTQALFMGSCKEGVVRNCVFEDNGNTGHIFVSSFGATSGTPSVCISGNRFGNTHGAYFSVNIHPDEIPLTAKVYVQPGQPTVASLCSRPQFVRECA